MHKQLYLLALGPAAPSSSQLSLPEGFDSEERKRKEEGWLFLTVRYFKI